MDEKIKSPSTKGVRLRQARRISQIIFFGLFLFLIFATAALTGSGYDANSSSSVPLPVEGFLNIDPLISIVVFLGTFSVPQTLLWSLFVIVLTIFSGRSFCGWICPMGALNHFFSEVKPSIKASKKIRLNKSNKYQNFKYPFLIILLFSALFGSSIAGLFDPISIITRGIALTILPLFDYFISGTTTAASNSSFLWIQHLSDGLYNSTFGFLTHQNGILTSGGIFLSLFFFSILFANRVMPRFWCRYVCPLGALLGIMGKFSLFSLKKNEHNCTNCGKCDRFCSGAASPLPTEKWKRSECDMCMNCVAVCKDDALDFKLSNYENDTCIDNPDLSKRQIISSVAAGSLLIPVLRTQSLTAPLGRPNPDCIRPPGAVEEYEFLKKCIRCGQCMKICPNNALHPAVTEAGLEGLWTPVLIPKIGYCEPSCTLCTQVCPTAAIKEVVEDNKTGANNKELLKIGTAFINRGRCLPWAMNTPCTVCEEFCPISPKAIRMDEIQETVNGETKTLKRPYVEPDLCSGCGACETVCPVHDKAAIVISSSGESRSKTNKLML